MLRYLLRDGGIFDHCYPETWIHFGISGRLDIVLHLCLSGPMINLENRTVIVLTSGLSHRSTKPITFDDSAQCRSLS